MTQLLKPPEHPSAEFDIIDQLTCEYKTNQPNITFDTSKVDRKKSKVFGDYQ